jgi:hypothetical protein
MTVKAEYIVDTDEEGINLFQGLRLISKIKWQNIIKIVAFKADLGTYDSVSLSVTSLPNNEAVIFHEEMDGFENLIKVLASRLSIIPTDWYEQIIQPPFATNETVLYEKWCKET